jgi:hypothetical protein
MGMKRGVPDVCLPVPRGGFHGLYVEMKRVKGGRPSPEQLWWRDKLREQGYRAEICCGWEDAVRVIREYLEMKGIGKCKYPKIMYNLMKCRKIMNKLHRKLLFSAAKLI